MNSTEDRLIKANTLDSRRAHMRDMFKNLKQYDVTALEVRGRDIRVSPDHWVTDFASCNYLGLDLDPQMHIDVEKAIERWGVHPSWCRLVASPAIYNEAEQRLAQLVGTEDALILPTVTLISIGVIPALVGKSGVLFLDKSGHETMYEGAKIARDSGAKLLSFRQGDFTHLEELLLEHKDNPRKVILVDGVYSMTGDYADISKLTKLAKTYDALVYVDDAHGFGVVGELPTFDQPYGFKGNGVVRHFNEDYENIIYVGGCSKAYSSLAAFVGCSSKMKDFLKAFSTPYDLSGPCPTASLSTLLQGLAINELKGEELRKNLYDLTRQTIEGLKSLGYQVLNKTGFPIVSVLVGDTDVLVATSNKLFDEGILITAAPFPMMPKGLECHRLTLTSANSEKDVEKLLEAFGKIKKDVISTY